MIFTFPIFTSDDGTARDKVARIKELETQRNRHISEGLPSYKVVACIDGRGFRGKARGYASTPAAAQWKGFHHGHVGLSCQSHKYPQFRHLAKRENIGRHKAKTRILNFRGTVTFRYSTKAVEIESGHIQIG